MLKLKSIKIKLLFFFLVVGLIPVLAGGFLSVHNFRQTLQAEISNKLTLFAEAEEGQIFAYFDSIKSRTEDFASDGYIRDNTGEILKTGSAKSVKELDEYLKREKQSLDPTLAGTLILDLKGKVIAATSDEEIGKDESKDQYFIEGQKTFFVIDLKSHQHFGVEKPLAAAIPLKDMDTKKTIGVLVNIFKPDKLSEILFGQLQKKDGALTSSLDRIGTLETYLVGSDKLMIVHPPSIKDQTSLAMQVNTLPVQNCLNNHQEVSAVYQNYNQKEVIGSSMCLVDRNWTLLIEVPTKDAFTPITAMERELVVLAVLLSIIIIVISFLFALGITKPIRILREAAEKISQGDLTYRTDIKTGDEIEQLATAFNEMTGKLQESYQGLEEKIAEKTKDLAGKLGELETTNQSLGSTEKAMLNILEDARGLEEALKVEKAGVEQKVVERTSQLKEEQARLEASINSLNVGFIMTDIKTQVLMMNGVAGRMFCFTENEVGSGGNLNGPLDLKCDIQTIQKALEGSFPLIENIQTCLQAQKPVDVEEINFRGKVFHIFIAPIVEFTQDLKVIGAVILIEDITEATLLERSRDEFFSIASHELRTPLTAIRGNSSLIQQFYGDKLVDKDLKEMVDDIHESSTRLIEIVNDFLDTSRLELKKMQFNNVPIDMVELATNVVKEYITTTSVKNLYLKFEEPKEKPLPIFADRDRVKQIIINLVGNAIKFTEKGGITIKLQPETGFLKILVSDTGRGIPPESQKLLFRKFQQTETNILTRDTTRGTGLGLYISKLIAEAMGGKIGLMSSEVNKGSTFFVQLPIATAEQIKAAAVPIAGTITMGTQTIAAASSKPKTVEPKKVVEIKQGGKEVTVTKPVS